MIAYWDCFAGISGSMILGALVDSGVPVEWLQKELEQMPLSGFALHSKAAFHSGIKAQNSLVELIGGQSFRDLNEIYALLGNSPYSGEVKSHSLAAFHCLADAQDHVYGGKEHAMHVPELGDTGTIVKIVGAMLGLEYLGIHSFFASAFPMGAGFLKGPQGNVPIPTPMTLEILKGWPVFGCGAGDEPVTATGAAIVTSLSQYSRFIPDLILEKIGYGAGTLESNNVPNLLRIIIGSPTIEQIVNHRDDVMVVETNIDDMNPEIYGYVMERLFEAGALDVVWVPIFMKKNRPGTKIEVLCRKEEKQKIVRCLLSETTSLGVRYYDARRDTLTRRLVEIDSPWGPIQAKEVLDVNGNKRMLPEYEVCRRIAIEKNLPLKHIYEVCGGLDQAVERKRDCNSDLK